jgi:DoxX-like family
VNTILWIVATPLALFLFTAASVRTVRYEFARQQMAWVGAVPRPLLVFISAAEIAGAIGLVVPGLLHVATPLAPLAAAGLGSIQVLALAFHVSRRELAFAAGNAVLLALLLFLVVGRSTISPF